MGKNKTAPNVNLPKTGFPMKGDLARREPGTLGFWEKLQVYDKLEKKNSTSPKFILHDGPPYANGHIHIGHVVNKVLKDFVIKYRMMSGYAAPFVPGWDCHGLPIEHQLMKEKKLTKHTIDLVDFRREASRFARKFIDIQRTEFKRLGILGDWEHPYLTMDPLYEKSIVRSFHDLLKKGFINRGKKPVLWCAACETALAEAEIEYDQHTSPSIFVAFPVVMEGAAERIASFAKFTGVNMVIWTTTPWTIPANVGIAVKPGRQYRFLKRSAGDARYLIETSLWDTRRESFEKELDLHESPDDPAPVPAEQLAGLVCTHPFIEGRRAKVILAEFVDVETGTGAVHIAPGHGEEDYRTGLVHELPVISPVDNAGRFTGEVPQFAGMKVFDANAPIIALLEKTGFLLHAAKTEHSYPHCWRCKAPVIFRATEQWFLSVEHEDLRKRMLVAIAGVEWVPGYGEARMRGMIESRPDWCLSRQRFWGTPITVLYCASCGDPLIDERVMRRIEERIGEEGTIIWFTAPVSDFVFSETTCRSCGGDRFKKEKDILDVWFDSGVSYEAVIKGDPRFHHPADLYLEGSDQHRGWFQTSLIPSVALNGRAPYRTVLTHGFVVDGEGKKMSKSVGNVVKPEEIIQTYGADMLRLWVFASDYREDIRISPEIIKMQVDAYRRIRNTLRFLLGNIGDFTPSKDRIPYDGMLEIDRWVLHELHTLIRDVRFACELYEFHRLWKMIHTFCAVTLSSLYFDILKDRLYTWRSSGKERRSAQTALADILHVLVRLIAPFLSFTAEETWQVFRTEHPDMALDESVFLAEFPKPDPARCSDELGTRWKRLFTVREHVTGALEKARQNGVVKSSLEAEVLLTVRDDEMLQFLGRYNDILDMIFIVSIVGFKRGTVPDGSEYAVEIRRAGGKKCTRCWRWQKDISGEAGTCPRCSDVLAQEGVSAG